MHDINPEGIEADILHLLTLKTMIDHCRILLQDIDIEVDPTLLQASDLDLMPELLGDLKSTLGTIVKIVGRMYLTNPQD